MTTPTVTRATHPESVLDALVRLPIVTELEASVEPSDGDQTHHARCGPGSRWVRSCPQAIYGGRQGVEPCKHATALLLLVWALPEPLQGDWASSSEADRRAGSGKRTEARRTA